MRSLPLVLALCVLGLSAAQAGAYQDVADSDYRRFFKQPTNAEEFWDAIQFEIEVGRFDLAANHLRGLMALNPPAAELVKLEEKVGLIPILRLRLIRKWSEDPKENEAAKKLAEDFIAAVSKAVKDHLGDPKRIERYVGRLSATPEEAAYALKELSRSGALAVPQIIEKLRDARGAERQPLLKALTLPPARGGFGPEIHPPLAAALDTDDSALKLDLLDVLRARGAKEAVPDLWFLSESPGEAPEVRAKARAMLAEFREVPEGYLPPAKRALTEEAERYYRRQVKFLNPGAVVVWRWEGGRLARGWPMAETVSASQAEQYYGTRYARQALLLDPSYRPAQEVLLSLAVDKAYERHGMDKPLEETAPHVHNLLSTMQPDLVVSVLDRAFADGRVPVIVGMVRDLGRRGDPLGLRPVRDAEPPLVRALFYPDRRVQFAAARAVLQTPGSESARVSGRVVEVLRRALAASTAAPPVPKAVVGYFDRDTAARVADTVQASGFEPEQVRTGRDVLRRLNAAADVDLLVLDAGLPMPGLASLLGQLRADVNSARLPLVLTVSSDEDLPRVRALAERSPNVRVVPLGVALDSSLLKAELEPLTTAPGKPVLTEGERKEYAEEAARVLAEMAKGSPPGYDVGPAGETILSALREGALSPAGQTALAAAASRLPGRKAQLALADALADTRRPAEVRSAVASELTRHVQRNGVLLTAEQVRAIREQYDDEKTDPAVKTRLAVVLGALRPGAGTTGARLLEFEPIPPGAPPKGDEPKEGDNP